MSFFFFPCLSPLSSPLLNQIKNKLTSFWIAIVDAGCSRISRARAQAASK